MTSWVPDYFMALLFRGGLIPKAIGEQLDQHPRIAGDLQRKLSKTVNPLKLIDAGATGLELHFFTAAIPWQKCHKCGHVWAIRKGDPPRRCPNHACRSTLWMQEDK